MDIKILEILPVESSHPNTLQQRERKWEGFEDSASMISHHFDVCTLRELGALGTRSRCLGSTVLGKFWHTIATLIFTDRDHFQSNARWFLCSKHRPGVTNSSPLNPVV